MIKPTYPQTDHRYGGRPYDDNKARNQARVVAGALFFSFAIGMLGGMLITMFYYGITGQ